jgi:CubicO group peptidase (beta-lactamase class C family)
MDMKHLRPLQRQTHIMRLFALIMLLVWTWSVPMLAHAQDATPDWDAIDAYVEAEIAADRVPGAALAIVRGTEIVHMRGFGFDGTGGTVSPQSSFVLGSMSKSFTALAIMQLVEEGKIELTAPVQEYVPWFRVADATVSSQITIQQLLNHTSGIPTSAARANNANRSIADHVRALASVELDAAPGTIHEYSSPNYQVLGAVVEQVSGQSFADYIQERIFTPLGMTHSYTSQDAAMGAGMALGHRYVFGFPQIAVLPYEADRLPTAAVIGSAEDLAHFLIAQLNGGAYGDARVLSAEGIAEMHRPTAQGEDYQYAMGWRVGKVRDVDAIHHGGVVSNYRGKMVMVPQGGWGVVVLTNISSMLPLTPTSHRIADNIAGSLGGTPLPAAGSNFKTAYFVIAIAIALLTVNQLKDLIQPRGWQQRFAEESRAAIIRSVAVELLMPIVVLVALPFVLRLPWTEILRSMPDIGYWMLASFGVGIALGIWKAVVAYGLIRTVPTDAPHPASP